MLAFPRCSYLFVLVVTFVLISFDYFLVSLFLSYFGPYPFFFFSLSLPLSLPLSLSLSLSSLFRLFLLFTVLSFFSPPSDTPQMSPSYSPPNVMEITGEFTSSQMFAWISQCVPWSSAAKKRDATTILHFRSTFVNSCLQIELSSNKAVFSSDSVTAISIIKELISKQATLQTVSIDTNFKLSPTSIEACLVRMKPQLDEVYDLDRKVSLLGPLKELAAHESDLSFLSKENRSLLQNAAEIEKQVADNPRKLDFLKGIVTDLFVDMCKLKGLDVSSRVSAIFPHLTNYDFASLKSEFDRCCSM